MIIYHLYHLLREQSKQLLIFVDRQTSIQIFPTLPSRLVSRGAHRRGVVAEREAAFGSLDVFNNESIGRLDACLEDGLPGWT